MLRQVLCSTALGLAVFAAASAPAYADHRGRPAPGWHGNDIRHFHDRDFGVWRGGRWYHGPHGGRAGWWWVTGGLWYYYSAPVYPYPDPYLPPAVVVPRPAAPLWYYCDAYRNYYPYVATCPMPWRAVPARP